MSTSGVSVRVLGDVTVIFDGTQIGFLDGEYTWENGSITISPSYENRRTQTLVKLNEPWIACVYVKYGRFYMTTLYDQKPDTTKNGGTDKTVLHPRNLGTISVEVEDGGTVNLGNNHFDEINVVVRGASFVSSAKSKEGNLDILDNGEITNVYVETVPRVSCNEYGVMKVYRHNGEFFGEKSEKVYAPVCF